jgi:hypothetical protein
MVCRKFLSFFVVINVVSYLPRRVYGI